MDTERLILFVVFSFSLLLLWEAWQTKDQEPQAATAVATETPAPQAAGGVPAATPVQAEQQVPQGKAIASGARAIVETDVYRAEVDANGGDLRKLELIGYHEHDNKVKSLVLLSVAASNPYAAQNGFTVFNGQQGMLPTHKDIFQLTPGAYKLTGDTLSLPLIWRNPATGITVEKTYVFHRGS